MKRLISLDVSTLSSFGKHPETIINEDISLQIAVATHPDTPRNVLEVLVSSDNAKVAEAARMHVNYAGELEGDEQYIAEEKLKNCYLGQNDRLAVELLKIAPVPAYFLSEYVPPEYLIQGLNNSHLPLRYRLQLLTRLAQEPTLEPRLQVAESPDTPLPVLEQLIGDLELAIRIAVEYNPNCPPELIELVKGQHEVASNWDTDTEHLDDLSNSNWDWIRLAVAQNPSSSEKTLLKLAGDKLFKIQLAVTKNPVTSPKVLVVLAEHSSKEIQAEVAKHPNVTEEILHGLFDTQQGIIESRDNLPASILEKIFNALPKDPQVPLFLLKYGGNLHFFTKQSNTPTWILAEFANIDLEKLRTYAEQQYPKSPIANQVEGWISDRCGGLIELAKHPQVSAEILEQLANFPDQRVKLAVALNQKYPKSLKLQILEELALSGEEKTKVKIASNRETPVSILKLITKNEFYPTKLANQVRDILSTDYPKNPHSFKSVAHQFFSEVKLNILYPAGIEVDVEHWMEVIEKLGLLEAINNISDFHEAERELYRLMRQKYTPLWAELLPSLSGDELAKVVRKLQASLAMATHQMQTSQGYRSVSVALVGNSNTPVALREQLKNQLIRPNAVVRGYSSDRDLFIALAYNSQVSEVDREKYFQKLIAEKNCAALIAQNPLTPVHILEHLFEQECEAKKGSNILQALAKNPAIPEHLCSKMADLRKQYLWRVLAENHNTPPDLLIRFVMEKIEKTVHSNVSMLDLVLANPNLPTVNRYQILLEQEEQREVEKSNQILAKRTDSPYALARVLETGDLNAKFSAARNHKTPIQVLKELAKDEDRTVRSVVTENSNLPLETLLELAEDNDVNIRAGLARDRAHKPTPIPILEKLAHDESERVRSEVANNRNTPIGILRRLAYDSSTEVCRRLTRNQNTPVETLEFLGVEKGIVNIYNANTPEKALAAAVEKTLQGSFRGGDKALNNLVKSYTSNMPAYILDRLADYPTSWIRSSVAHHHNTPASALEKMIDDDYGVVLWGISRNPNTPPHLLERLVNKPDLSEKDRGQIYPSIAGRKDIPETLMEKLLECNLYGVRENIVSKPNLPLEIAERLIKEESKESVLISLARNPILTTELLTEFVQHPNINVCRTLINHPNLTLEHWQQLAQHSDSDVRKAIASSVNTPVNILETLARDTITDVRVAVAGNSNTPSNVLEQLSTDVEATVRTKVAGNSNTAIDVLETLAEDESVEVRRAVANNKNSSEAIKELLKDLLPAVKAKTQSLSPTLRGLSRIYKPDTDDLPTVLSEYVNSDVAFVRFVSLLHPLTPTEILETGAKSISWIERYAVANNSNTPTEIKQQLAQDSNQIVRAVASHNQ